MDTTQKGQRVRMIHMKDAVAPVPTGTEGTIKFKDDAGQIHVKWDNGSTLAIIPGEDKYEIINNK